TSLIHLSFFFFFFREFIIPPILPDSLAVKPAQPTSSILSNRPNSPAISYFNLSSSVSIFFFFFFFLLVIISLHIILCEEILNLYYENINIQLNTINMTTVINNGIYRSLYSTFPSTELSSIEWLPSNFMVSEIGSFSISLITINPHKNINKSKTNILGSNIVESSVFVDSSAILSMTFSYLLK